MYSLHVSADHCIGPQPTNGFRRLSYHKDQNVATDGALHFALRGATAIVTDTTTGQIIMAAEPKRTA